MLTKAFRPISGLQIRALNLHEYQAKELMDAHGVATQIGLTASTPKEVFDNSRKLFNQGVDTVVLKAQVFAGGRGKGRLTSGLQGGVQFAKTPQEAKSYAARMLGYRLITHQTTSEGLQVNKLLLTEGIDIDRELYLAMVLDRSMGGPVIVVSREGGMDIEEVSEKNPGAIKTIPVDIKKGLGPREIALVCETLLPDVKSSIPKNAKNLSCRQKKAIYESLNDQLKELITRLYRMFLETDGQQVEINPLAITSDDRMLCVDSKLTFDDNAAFRQKPLFAQEDLSVRCPLELAAEELNMNYVTMDGNVGCLVNGAGLAMATMDLLMVHGGSPANFLDLGGGATKEQVLKAFEVLTSDPKVKAIFVNIFGGITRCDVVAQGIIDAAQQCNMNRPLIVRLAGNNAVLAKELLSKPIKGLRIEYVQDFSEAARTAVRIASRPESVSYSTSA